MFMTLASSPIDDIQSFAGLLFFVLEALALCALAGLFVICAFARDQLQSRLPLRLSLVQYFTEFCFILFLESSVGVIALRYHHAKAIPFGSITPAGVIGAWRYQNLYCGFQGFGDCSLS
jgi:uncharacterized membrane protein YesL